MRKALGLLLIGLMALPVASACDPGWTSLQVPGDAPSEAGGGPRALEIDVRVPSDRSGSAAVVATWARDADGPADDGRAKMERVWARTDADGKAVLNVPDDRDVWVGAGHLDMVVQWRLPPRDADALVFDLFGADVGGTETGTWETGAYAALTGPVWRPHDLTGFEDLTRFITDLELTLSWENTPTAAGDLGIAIGTGGDRFQYRNAAFQTNLGTFEETWLLDADGLRELGVTDARALRIGPSISTGHYSVTGLDYTLTWTAHMDARTGWPAMCSGLEGRSIDWDGSGDPGLLGDLGDLDGDGRPSPLAFLAVLGLIVAGAVALSLVRRR